MRNGIVRALPLPHHVQLFDDGMVLRSGVHGGGFLEIADDAVVWGGSVIVQNAYRVRLRLADVRLPKNAQLWVYSDLEERSFGLELLDPEGGLWTPSVEGNRIFLEVKVPSTEPNHSANAGFGITEVVELFELGTTGVVEKVGECLLDAQCVDSSTLDVIDAYRRAVAQLQYVKDQSSYVCTGALLNDTDTSSAIPYLLTANHCFSTQSSASSLEATWDYTTASCFGSLPGSLPTSNGSTLLGTGASSDFTLVRLNSIPSGRVLLGWNASSTAVTGGATLHRISHPAPSSVYPQMYSQTAVNTSVTSHPDLPRPNYIYQDKEVGATLGGSSGAPVILSGGFVVGQLYGVFGTGDLQDDCNPDVSTVDGAFSATFPAIASYLNPANGSDPCVETSTTACLIGGRFEVKATFRDQNGGSGNLRLIDFTDNTLLGYFSDPNNIEVLGKVLNACSFSGQYWVFLSGVTNQEINLTVWDTETGAARSYFNPLFQKFVTITDTTAFSCN